MNAVALAGGVALVLGLLLTPAVRAWAVRRGWVSPPRSDRWGTRTVALMGGIAIAAATLLAVLPYYGLLGFPEKRLLLVSFAVFIVGVVDDRINIKPHTKLIAQVVAAAALVQVGFRFGFPGEAWRLWDAILTMVWLVGICNAFNLLDNMDGLCAGIAFIAATFMTIMHAGSGALPAAAMTAALAGACLGYLRYNRHPATIFMGDCGSLFIGFYLAGAVLLNPGRGVGRSVLSVLSLPVLVMLIPVLDTCLVTIARKWARRPVSQGGCDHTSHRLVAIGLSEPRAVMFLYALGVAGGLVALAVRWLDWYLSTLLLPVMLFLVAAIGLHLGQVRVYESEVTIDEWFARTPIPLLARHRYRRRIAEVILDSMAIVAGYYAAFVLRFEGGFAQSSHVHEFLSTVPAIIVCHLVAYFVVGVYRGMWRLTNVGDLPRFAGGVTLGLAFTLAALTVGGYLPGMSKSLFAINWLLQWTFLAGTRLSLRVIRDGLLAARERRGARVLAVGVGEQAELGLRCLHHETDLNLVGTVSEEPGATGKRLLNVPVIGNSAEAVRLLPELGISQVVLLDPDYPADALESLREACGQLHIPVQCVRYVLEPYEGANGRHDEIAHDAVAD